MPDTPKCTIHNQRIPCKMVSFRNKNSLHIDPVKDDVLYYTHSGLSIKVTSAREKNTISSKVTSARERSMVSSKVIMSSI